ncbi:MAG TPA: molybdopterin cofactor-binding domain-containing protein [Usitatibacter sp.]|jgi:CO/xanthine dehydrogenase Mo-binding subunit|nr:molybdopterin cofactor-binding domain-containing protein [Usitatibacter sp.]
MEDFVVTHRGVTRRDFLKAGGAMVVTFALPGCATTSPAGAAPLPVAGTAWPAKLDAASLDTWLAIAADGSVTASVGKIEAGMGIGTAFAQIVAEELDVPVDRVTIVMGDTATTPDQRGTGSSNGIMTGGAALRRAGAEGRAALLLLASKKLEVPVERLRVQDGRVFVADDPSKRVSYGELVGGKRFDVKVTEKPKTKDPREYRVVGQPVQRFDIPSKVRGEYRYAADLVVPGMLHGRVIRPPEAGARLVRVNESQRLPGLVKIVRRDDFLGVVCEREEQAVDAARRLEVEWTKPAPMYWPSYDALFEHLRTAAPKVTQADKENRGDVDAAFASAVRRVEARYEYPFQSHASMGPACAVVDVRDGGAIVWSGGQKPYPLRHALADLLKLPAEKVRVVWMPGAGSYGMNDADDCAADCALLAQAAGRPVRLQYMRHDATGWDPKGPPVAFTLRAALDAGGAVSGWDCEARGFSGDVRPSGTDVAGDTLAGQLTGLQAKSKEAPQFPEEGYGFPAKRKVSHLLPWLHSLGTPLRTAHLRDPDGMSTCFASESFVDEVAYASGADPVEFRLRHLIEAGEIAVVQAAAEKAGWQRHTAPRAPEGRIVRGQGLAYAPRHGSLVAVVADVEADRATGRFRVTRFTVAHDCGFVINPLNLRGTIEANLMQAMSRAKHEAVRFDATRVLSVDWITYPIVDTTEVPDTVEIVMLNNTPKAKPHGAGEPTTRPVAAAIANALHDALGVRVRRVPFTPEAVLAAIRA